MTGNANHLPPPRGLATVVLTVIVLVPIWIMSWFEFKYHVIDQEEVFHFSAHHPAWVQGVVQVLSVVALWLGKSWLTRRRSSVRWLWVGAMACIMVNLQVTTRFVIGGFEIYTLVAAIPVAQIDGVDHLDGALCFRSFSHSAWGVVVNGERAWTPFLPLPVDWEQIDLYTDHVCQEYQR